MGGFGITDQERNPVQVLILHPSHLNHVYFKSLLPIITKVDDETKARLRRLLTYSLKGLVVKMGNKPRGFPNTDAVVDEIIPLLMSMSIKIVSGSELLLLLLSHEAAVQSLVMNMATEAVKIAFPITGMSVDMTLERFELKLRARLENRLKKGLPKRLRGIKKTLEADIQGRSRKDWLAKTIALAQTTWFVAQCVARRVQHLPLTEIELMACAYATLNAAVYWFWWQKPFRVDCPIMLRSQIPSEARKVNQTTTNLYQFFLSILGGNVYDGQDFYGKVQMPTFDPGCLYNYQEYQTIWNGVAEVLTAVVFGGIHLFAWNYQFPTHVELWLWRISAITLVGIPLFLCVTSVVLPLFLPIPYRIWKINISTVPLLYILARLSILILSLISLRKLPVGALSNVDWLTFVPHID